MGIKLAMGPGVGEKYDRPQAKVGDAASHLHHGPNLWIVSIDGTGTVMYYTISLIN